MTRTFSQVLCCEKKDNRQVLRACLEQRWRPLMGRAPLLEYEEVLGREPVFRRAPLSAAERRELFEAFLSVCDWVHVYYLWRPNLPDLRFPNLRVLSPRDALRELL